MDDPYNRLVAFYEERAKGGFDKVVILGSEGYFLNQFTAERTNR